jgi:hypothetical protein
VKPVGASSAKARAISATKACGSIGGRLMLKPFSTGT